MKMHIRMIRRNINRITAFILILSFITVNTNAQIMRINKSQETGITCKNRVETRYNNQIRQYINTDSMHIKNKIATIYSILGCVSVIIVTLIMGNISYHNRNWAVLWSPLISVFLGISTVNYSIQHFINNIFMSDYEMMLYEELNKRSMLSSSNTILPFFYMSGITYLIEIIVMAIVGIIYFIGILILNYIFFTARN